MFFNEHGIAHFHAVYGEYNSVYNIETLEVIEGDLPPRAKRLVKEWAEEQKMWETKKFHTLPPLK